MPAKTRGSNAFSVLTRVEEAQDDAFSHLLGLICRSWAVLHRTRRKSLPNSPPDPPDPQPCPKQKVSLRALLPSVATVVPCLEQQPLSGRCCVLLVRVATDLSVFLLSVASSVFFTFLFGAFYYLYQVPDNYWLLPSMKCIRALFSVCFYFFRKVAVGVGASVEKDQSAPVQTAPWLSD